jgi:cytochrome c biogenesis protein CcmG/thiol:disulfide interchange protein DsbE
MDLCATGFSRESMIELHNWLVGSVIGFFHRGGAHTVVAKHDAGRRIAPDFTLTDASGKAVRLSDYKGKVVLLNFWATWCAPCREETPWFVEFQSKYRDRGFVVLGVSLDDDGWKSVKPFMEAKHMNYPVMIGSDEVATQYRVKSLPETMIIDESGRIAVDCTGLIGRLEYAAAIEALLKGSAL